MSTARPGDRLPAEFTFRPSVCISGNGFSRAPVHPAHERLLFASPGMAAGAGRRGRHRPRQRRPHPLLRAGPAGADGPGRAPARGERGVHDGRVRRRERAPHARRLGSPAQQRRRDLSRIRGGHPQGEAQRKLHGLHLGRRKGVGPDDRRAHGAGAGGGAGAAAAGRLRRAQGAHGEDEGAAERGRRHPLLRPRALRQADGGVQAQPPARHRHRRRNGVHGGRGHRRQVDGPRAGRGPLARRDGGGARLPGDQPAVVVHAAVGQHHGRDPDRRRALSPRPRGRPAGRRGTVAARERHQLARQRVAPAERLLSHLAGVRARLHLPGQRVLCRRT